MSVGDDPITLRIRNFLAAIDIPVTMAPIAHPTLLPGIAIHKGGLLLDPHQAYHPGDLLHEAGHLAVSAPALRPHIVEIPADGGEEMAAIAWSYAAATALGIAPTILFHEAGYGGNATAYADAFASGRSFGVPLLHHWGMTTEPGRPSPGRSVFPAMDRWLR